MFRFILRRALETIPVLFAVATITFFMLRLAPGGPFDSDREAPPSVKKKLDEITEATGPADRALLLRDQGDTVSDIDCTRY